ncbi:MAG TPA: GNAT family N-acetyltransferase [Nannocystis sp.]
MAIRRISAGDRAAIRAIVAATGVFTDEEVRVADELVADAIARPDESGYHALVLAEDDIVRGYACFGPTPLTEGTFDLYWIAVDPRAQSRGYGRTLLRAVEDTLRAQNARLLLVEAAGRPDNAKTLAFYARCGYAELARIRDFYRPGDDKVVFGKYLAGS